MGSVPDVLTAPRYRWAGAVGPPAYGDGVEQQASVAVDPATVDGRGTVVDGERVVGALSPSAIAEFRDCALRFRLRRHDRVPEPPSPEALRGTLVHLVLERLFDLPAAERTPQRADALVLPGWRELAVQAPELADLVPDDELDAWLAPCRRALASYFDLEDPRVLEPAERELYVETLLDSRLLLRGVVDRLDVADDGRLRVVDYKSGRSPGVGFEQRALAQLRFYALVIWRSRGVLPAELRLVYLGDTQTVTYVPDVAELLATERLAESVWDAVREATASGGFEPQPGRACRWCSYQALCPAYDGTPPPYPPSDPVPIPAGSVQQRPEVGGSESLEGVAEGAALPGLDGGVGGHDEHQAPGRIGGGDPGR